MGKECKIYYGIVVEETADQRWSQIGSCSMEPIKVEEREPIGKEPEFCCKEFESQMNEYNIVFYYRLGEEVGLQARYVPGRALKFCPFCGAKIILKEHLKLKVVETPITTHTYHYEAL